MKLVTYKIKNRSKHQIGVVHKNTVSNLNDFFGNISLVDLIQIENYQDKIAAYILNENHLRHDFERLEILPTIPNPNSFRDAYAFRQHVETSRKNRGLEMIPEFDEFPVFYFSNHNSMYADKAEIEVMPDHFEKLDFELEFAIVIGKSGKNILAKDAEKHIGGFFILNDLSARKLQMDEMKLNLGPSKGKDFANVIGPYLVTPDELESRSINTKRGKKYNMTMRCYVNGELLSTGNTKDMKWTFAEIIERASYGVELSPGDIIGSGTVGTGCLLELNGTAKTKNSDHIERWIQEDDEIVMRIDGLGQISNKIIKSKNNHSILKLKK